MSYRQQLRRDLRDRVRFIPAPDKRLRQVRAGDVIEGEIGEMLEVIGHVEDGTEDGTDMVLGRVVIGRSGRHRVEVAR